MTPTPSARTRFAVWGLSGPQIGGNRFVVTIGARREDGRSLAGCEILIADSTGDEVSRAVLGNATWADTSLYWIDVSLIAPHATGRHEWSVRCAERDGECPAAEYCFGIVSIRPPEHELTVEVLAAATSEPVGAAHVRAGPYGAVTDDFGRATLQVATGEYTVVAWKTALIASQEIVAVNVDTEVRLALEPMVDRDPQYIAMDLDFTWT